MVAAFDDRRIVEVLQHKRDATRYRILVEVADRQPAVSQREIAESIDLTAQAVSDYVRELVDTGHVRKLGRGRYEITKEGVDWLINRTDELQAYTAFVSEEVVDQVEIEAAIATESLPAGETVTLSMNDGVLHAAPGDGDGATATAVAPAERGAAVAVTDFDGIVEYDPGRVTVLSLPNVSDSAHPAETRTVTRWIDRHDVLAAAGVEALTIARSAGHEPTIRFGTPSAVREAAVRGLDVLLLTVESGVSRHTDLLREANLSYEVVDPVDS